MSMHPGVTREQVQETCGWKVRFADGVEETPPPSELELTNVARAACPHRACSRREGSLIMREAYICAYARTPIGRYGGALASVRADDLGAVPLRAIMERFPRIDLRSRG